MNECFDVKSTDNQVIIVMELKCKLTDYVRFV